MKRALLIGINYVGTQSELRGCINDINNVAAYLQTARSYPAGSCIVLSDAAPRKPTRANILAAFKELLQGVRAGDELWFHYSGHGSLQRDSNGDEESGADSCICPLDYGQAGLITDDVVRSELAARVPAGVRLYVILDMCHSGTGCDLRYKFDDTSYLVDEAAALPRTYEPAAWALRQTSYEFKRHAKTAGEVFCISGCQDTQTSADAYLGGQAAGALTHSLLQSLGANPGTGYKWKHLLKDVCCRERVGRFPQRTSLTCGQPLNLEDGVFVVAPAVAPVAPTVAPVAPTVAPTAPTVAPAVAPVAPTVVPVAPTVVPTVAPTVAPVAPTVVPVAPTVVPTVAPTVAPAPFVLPDWIQTYLRQLRQMGRRVPQWLTAYIAQLKRLAMNKRDIGNPNQKLTMKMLLSR